MKKAEFKEIIDEGIRRGKEFLAVRIETEGNPGPEIIINPRENFDAKIKYYMTAYNDDMELIKAKEGGKIVKITKVFMTNNFHDFAWFAY